MAKADGNRIRREHSPRWLLEAATEPALSTVGIAQAHPGVAHLLVMHHRVVELDGETKPLHRQCTDRREQGVRGDHAVVLGGDQRNARVHQLLLSVEHVERGPLSNASFLAHTVEGDFRRVHLRRRRFDLRLGGIELSPALHHGRSRLVTVDVEIEPLLAKRFFGLTDRRYSPPPW